MRPRSCALYGVAQGRALGQRQAVQIAQHLEGNALFFKAGQFLAQKIQQQGKEGAYFSLGAVPVFTGKSVERQVAYANFAAFGNDGAHGFRASLVPGLARQVAGLCPASVAVHDDGQVCGQQIGQKLRRRPGLRGGVRVWRSAGRLAGRGRALLRHTFSLWGKIPEVWARPVPNQKQSGGTGEPRRSPPRPQ